MKKCEICGRETNRVQKFKGYLLCPKHMHQLIKYGCFLDSIPRTSRDLNDYCILGETAIFNVYNQKNKKIGQFTIDKDDLEKVKYKKWRYSHGHVVTGQPAKRKQKELSHIILDLDCKQHPSLVVDYINGDVCDNRKQNLRICTQDKNILNKSFASNNTRGFVGVTYRKDRNSFDPEIRLGCVRCHLGYTKTLEEAVYKRYVAEQLLFQEYANEAEQNKKYQFTNNLSAEKKQELHDIVVKKLVAKGLWQ